MSTPPRHTTRFTFVTTACLNTPTEAEQMEAKASLDKLKPLLPSHFNPDTDETIVYAVGNLVVAGVANLNDDSLTIEDALRVYPRFANQFVDVEHGRGTVVGFIIRSGLSEFGTDRLITEDEARASGNPFNIAIAMAFWKVVDPDLCNFILQSSGPASPDKDKLSLSFEVGFDDYNVVVLPKGASNLALATRIVTPDSPEFDRFDRMLRANGGKGNFGKDNARVARILSGNIVPLGAGVVTVPAAAVKGMTAITESPHTVESAQTADAGLYKYSSTQVTLGEVDAAPLRAYALSIPDEHICTDEKDPTLGRELASHITCVYGITTNDITAISKALAGFGPIRVKLGAVSCFEGSDDRPYDVLKLDVDSEDLHRAHALIKTATEVVSKWPDFHPHATICYMKKGMASGYVGDTRFVGTELVFSSIMFHPKEGDRVEIPLGEVYDQDVATASRYIKLSDGWQTRIAEIKAAALPTGGDPLVNGVNITLSDGRKMMNVKVFDGATLELDKELSMSGVVITDMTPGVGLQADSPVVEHPHKVNVAPTTSPEQQARDAADQAKDNAGRVGAYTDAADKGAKAPFGEALKNTIVAAINSMSASVLSITSASAPQTSPPMPIKLEDLKQSIANVKSVDELPTVTASVAMFVEEIAKASEEQSKARKAAETLAADTKAAADEIRTQLAALQTQHDAIKAEQAATAAAAKYQERMATVDEVFELDTEIKAEIVDEVKACTDDESFAKWLGRAKKMMKPFMKKKKGADSEPDDDDAKAAKAAATALASAANNGVDAAIANTLVVDAKTLSQRYAETFTKGIKIAGIAVAELNKQPIKAVK